MRKEKVEKPEEEQKQPLWKELLDMVIYLAVVAAVCLLFIRFVAVRSVVEGTSMYPLLNNKDNVIVEKVSYYFRKPARFDIIVFELPDQKRVHYIKRIIGLPGETVQIKNGQVYINGEVLEGDVYCSEPILEAYTAATPILLKDDEYFVMGDNRNRSKDSRSVDVGPVKRSQFLGRAWFRFWPLKSIGILNHR